MRLWSIHPKYLDAKGLVALWRESLLAQSVLLSKTGGYKNHPQLKRFKNASDPVSAIGSYLWVVYKESCRRGYCFAVHKIISQRRSGKISVTKGQVEYEWKHYLQKIKRRSPKEFVKWRKISAPDHHPLFRVNEGEREEWEKARSAHRRA